MGPPPAFNPVSIRWIVVLNALIVSYIDKSVYHALPNLLRINRYINIYIIYITYIIYFKKVGNSL